jgi:hypothetical protein
MHEVLHTTQKDGHNASYCDVHSKTKFIYLYIPLTSLSKFPIVKV